MPVRRSIGDRHDFDDPSEIDMPAVVNRNSNTFTYFYILYAQYSYWIKCKVAYKHVGLGSKIRVSDQACWSLIRNVDLLRSEM